MTRYVVKRVGYQTVLTGVDSSIQDLGKGVLDWVGTL